MTPLRIAVVQVAHGDDERVAERVARVAATVRGLGGHDLVVLPELWPVGGFDYRRWAEQAEAADGPIAATMAQAARDAGVVLHTGSIVERGPAPGPEGKWLWNTSLVFGPDGSELARYRKIHRFGFATGEPELMEAGDEVVVFDLPVGVSAGGAEADGGPATRTVRAGLSTCYDLRFPELYRRQLDLGAQVLLVPAAWPAARVGHWSLFARARAVEEQCLVIACNTAGTHCGVTMGGRSVVVLPTGDVVAEAGADDEEVLSVEVDLEVIERTRAVFPVLADRRLRMP